MAQYFTDFSSGTPGSFPAGWTDELGGSVFTVETVSGATGGVVLRKASTGVNTSRVLSFDAVDAASELDRETIEVITRFRVVSGAVDFAPAVPRMTTATGITGNDRYEATVPTTTARRINTAGTVGFVVLVTNTSQPNISTNWWWCRTQATGKSPTTLKARWWLSGDPEPTTDWLLDTTDSGAGLQQAGFAGLATWSTGVYEWDVFGVGTGGDPAPTEAPATGPTITNVPNMTRGTQATITGTGFGT